MKPLLHALQAVFGTMLILGCASTSDLKPEVRPMLIVQHGGAQADGYYQLGRYYQSQGRVADAEIAYRKALALDDRLAEAHSALGAIYALNGSFLQALAALDAAVVLDPSAPHFRNNLGYAYYLQGRTAEAIANFEVAAALDPANPRTWNNLGLALVQGGKVDRAEAAYARATALASAEPIAVKALPPAFASTASIAPAALSAPDVPTAPARVEQVDPVATSPVAILRPMDSSETKPPAELAAALATPIATPTGVPIATPSAAPMVAPIEAPMIAPIVAPAPESALQPVAASGTVVVEVPTVADFVTVAPHALELRWSGFATLARPAVASDVGVPERFGLEVSNGNGVTGMARRVDGMLQTVGLDKARLTNQKPFVQRTTEIRYRAHHEAAAAALGARLPVHPAMIRDDRLRADIDVRLVLGKDLGNRVALVDPAADRVRSAEAAGVPGSRGR